MRFDKMSSQASIRRQHYRRHHKPLWRSWRKLCALGLGTAYSTLLLFAVLCVATGAFHPDTPHDHDDSHHHHHHPDADSRSPSVRLDICEFAWQALMSTTWDTEPLPAIALLRGEPVKLPMSRGVVTAPDVSPGIRAPPGFFS